MYGRSAVLLLAVACRRHLRARCSPAALWLRCCLGGRPGLAWGSYAGTLTCAVLLDQSSLPTPPSHQPPPTFWPHSLFAPDHIGESCAAALFWNTLSRQLGRSSWTRGCWPLQVVGRLVLAGVPPHFLGHIQYIIAELEDVRLRGRTSAARGQLHRAGRGTRWAAATVHPRAGP